MSIGKNSAAVCSQFTQVLAWVNVLREESIVVDIDARGCWMLDVASLCPSAGPGQTLFR